MSTATLRQLNTKPSLGEALDVVDALRADIISGKAVAFACVAIGPNDETIAYVSAVYPVSRLRILGAMAHFGHLYNEGKEED